MKTLAAVLLALPLTTLLTASCWPGGPGSMPTPVAPTSGVCAPMLTDCPLGAFTQCEPDAGVTRVDCCSAGATRQACALKAGILTNTCPGCPPNSGVCAVSLDLTVSCCAFGGC